MKRNAAETATILVNDASTFSVTERSIWHFNKMYKLLPLSNPKQPTEIDSNLSLLTLSASSSSPTSERLVLSPQTQLNFVYQKYRFVVSIDTSMSLFATDITTGIPLWSSIPQKLYTLFLEFIRSVYIPNTQIIFSPEIYVSVVAQGTHPNPIVVLVQGFKLSPQTLPNLLEILKKQLKHLEDKIVKTLKDDDANVSVDLSNALRNAALALKFLPKEACSVTILVTDGVLGPPETMKEYDNLVMDFNRHGIPINILQLGQNLNHSTLPFGFLDNTKSLRWMCAATGGTMLSLPKMNIHQLDASWNSMMCKVSKQPPNKTMFCLLWRFSHVSTRLKKSKRIPDLRRGELGRFGPRDPRRTIYKELTNLQNRTQRTNSWTYLKREADRSIRIVHDFPWNDLAAPPVPVCTKQILNYSLTGYVESHDIMMCRILEGFHVNVLSTAADANHKIQVESLICQNPESSPSKCYVVLLCKLEYPWQPDVTIQ